MVLADAAQVLLEQAVARVPSAQVLLGDLAALSLEEEADVVACRGVLNGVLADEHRDAVLAAFARAPRRGGVVVIDVRDRDATAARYARGRSVRGQLEDVEFSSDGVFDGDLLRVRERHRGRGALAVHEVVMRPWTPAEAVERLSRTGFVDVDVNAGGPGREDRLVVAARRGGAGVPAPRVD